MFNIYVLRNFSAVNHIDNYINFICYQKKLEVGLISI